MSDSLNVFISGFPRSYGERELAELAGAHGEIVNCKVLRGALICVCGCGLPWSFVCSFALVFRMRRHVQVKRCVAALMLFALSLFELRLAQLALFVTPRLASVLEKCCGVSSHSLSTGTIHFLIALCLQTHLARSAVRALRGTCLDDTARLQSWLLT